MVDEAIYHTLKRWALRGVGRIPGRPGEGTGVPGLIFTTGPVSPLYSSGELTCTHSLSWVHGQEPERTHVQSQILCTEKYRDVPGTRGRRASPWG